MNRFVALASAAFVVVGIQGCTNIVPQQANLSPKVSVIASNEGRNIAVGVRVIDERASKDLGRHGFASTNTAEITATQDIVMVVQQQVLDGLRMKGFNPVKYGAPKEPQLTIEIRLLEYTTFQLNLWTGDIRVKGALKAVATRASSNYERMYRSENEKSIERAGLPSAEWNEQFINATLTDLLNDLFKDKDLFKFLAGQPVVP